MQGRRQDVCSSGIARRRLVVFTRATRRLPRLVSRGRTSKLSNSIMDEQSLADNPLIIERFPIQFDAIKAEHVEAAIHYLLVKLIKRHADLANPELPSS